MSKKDYVCKTVPDRLLFFLFCKYGDIIIKDKNYFVAEMHPTEESRRFILVYYDEEKQKIYIPSSGKNTKFNQRAIPSSFFEFFLGYREFRMFYGSHKLTPPLLTGGAP